MWKVMIVGQRYEVVKLSPQAFLMLQVNHIDNYNSLFWEETEAREEASRRNAARLEAARAEFAALEAVLKGSF